MPANKYTEIVETWALYFPDESLAGYYGSEADAEWAKAQFCSLNEWDLVHLRVERVSLERVIFTPVAPI